MNIQFCSLFPQDAAIKDAAGLPMGATLQPLAPLNKDQHSVQLDIGEVARCDQCFGYINSFVMFDRRRWKCSFCNTYNLTPPRYATPMLRRELPELSAPTVELELQGEESVLAQEQPLNLLLVDLSGDGQYLEMVKAGLQAALDVMDGSGFVGLLSFSESLGVWELRSPAPHVRQLPLAEDGLPAVELQELVSLETVAVQLEPHREHLSTAIDNMEPSRDGSEKRAFGAALSSVLRFVRHHSDVVSSARVTCFLSGLPNHGAGALGTQYTEGEELTPQCSFYSELGALAAELGVGVDLLAGCSSYCALPSLRGAVEPTGGVLALYREQQSVTVTEDIYNLLTRPHAFNGLLRLRCPEALQVAHAYGNWSQDKHHQDLHHVALIDEHRSFGFDFEFSNTTHFKYGAEQKAILQAAFAFSRVHNGRLRRFQRICTVQHKVSRSVKEICDCTAVPVTMSLLAHKVMAASCEDGVQDAQLLLQDWLILLMAQYTQHAKTKSLPSVEQLHALQLPRFVYALLVSPLLSSKLNPDQRVAAQWLFSALAPEPLSKALYPRMAGFSSASTCDHEQLFLSRKALLYGHQTEDRIFVLDGLQRVLVMCCAAHPIEFPPAHPECALRKMVARCKQNRLLSPAVSWFDSQNAAMRTEFEGGLLEEKDSSGVGFEEFLDFVKEEVRGFGE